ncbi:MULTISPECIES: hypothetical protein [Achromobacter]|nr:MULTISPECIES: hypothetical protein [Achromobacter]MBD9433267.1 DNA-3-methyladenine glycosylase [Achromobacter sp. ACM03]
MERDELLAQMVSRSAELSSFGDWVDVLGRFADCLSLVSKRLEPAEVEQLLDVGATFYRTLARAEGYRLSTTLPPKG